MASAWVRHPAPAGLLARLATAYGPGRSMSALLAVILTAPEVGAARGSTVIGPVDWLIGAVRALQVPVTSAAAAEKLVTVLKGLGQVPFYPPSIGGWPSGQAWLSTAAADVRLQAATALTKGAQLQVIRAAGASSRVEAAAHLLDVASWSPRSAAVLQDLRANPEQLVAVALNTPEYLTN